VLIADGSKFVCLLAQQIRGASQGELSCEQPSNEAN